MLCWAWACVGKVPKNLRLSLYFCSIPPVHGFVRLRPATETLPRHSLTIDRDGRLYCALPVCPWDIRYQELPNMSMFRRPTAKFQAACWRVMACVITGVYCIWFAYHILIINIHKDKYIKYNNIYDIIVSMYVGPGTGSGVICTHTPMYTCIFKSSTNWDWWSHTRNETQIQCCRWTNPPKVLHGFPDGRSFVSHGAKNCAVSLRWNLVVKSGTCSMFFEKLHAFTAVTASVETALLDNFETGDSMTLLQQQ